MNLQVQRLQLILQAFYKGHAQSRLKQVLREAGLVQDLMFAALELLDLARDVRRSLVVTQVQRHLRHQFGIQRHVLIIVKLQE